MKLYFVIACFLFAIVCTQNAPDKGCDASRNEMLEALQDLFLVGDTDMLFPNDQVAITKHCEVVEKLAKEKLGHVDCLNKGPLKLIFGTLANGYVKVNKVRCSNQEWRAKFLRLSECVRRSEIADDVHQCAFKIHDAMEYGMKNFGVDHQLQFTCCIFQSMDACLHSQLVRDCGDEIANFGPHLFWEPIRESFTISCPGVVSLDQCRKMYPKQMKEAEEIFWSKNKLTPRNFLEVGYRIVSNRGNKMPEKVNV